MTRQPALFDLGVWSARPDTLEDLAREAGARQCPNLQRRLLVAAAEARDIQDMREQTLARLFPMPPSRVSNV
jgi:hypothetical protein